MLITKEHLQNLQADAPINGVILVKDYKVALTKGGKEYITGELMSGISVRFKAWNQSVAFRNLKNERYEGVPALVTGTVESYEGTLSIVLNSVQAVEGYTPDQFFPIRYNIDAYWDALKSQIAARVSPKGLEICNQILFNNESLVERFKVEFAAKSHHDNCKGGLLAHTYKTLNVMANIITQYPDICAQGGEDFADLLFIGTLLHDIGKTVEINFGVYTPESIVTHRYLGLEFIQPYKNVIVEAYDEMWYYNLVSILLQHHGEFGDPCKTVAAYLVHKADMFEAEITFLSQSLETSPDGTVRVNDRYLTL